jgi:MFS family permease
MALFSGTVFIGREWGKPWAKSSLHAFADFPALPSTAVIGPVIAGYLSAAGWRWNYYLLLIIVGISWVCTTIFLPETYAPVLLRHRAAKLRKETGDPTYMTEQERHKRSLSEIIKIALFRPMEMLFTEPIILFITVSIRRSPVTSVVHLADKPWPFPQQLYLSLIYSILYIFFFAFPIIFGKLHNFSLGSVGLSFLAILIGMIGAFFTVLPYQKTLYLRSTEKADAAGHVVAPEARLPAMMIGSIALPIGLFIFAWTSYSHVHWIAPMIGGGIFGWAMISIYVGANSYVIDAFSTYAASAMAAKTFLSRVAGASIPMFVDRYYESAIGVNWASAVIAFIALIMVPIPFIFNKYGHRIRAASKKASS